MPSLNLGLGLGYGGGYVAGSTILAPLAQTISIGRGDIADKLSALTSISDYATYIDTSIAYTTSTAPSWLNIYNGPAFEDIASVNVYFDFAGFQPFTKSSTKYVLTSLIQYYGDEEQAQLGPFEFRWNGTAWELFGKANYTQGTASVLKTYTGGSSVLLPPTAGQTGSYTDSYGFTHPRPTTKTLSAPNATGKYNQILFYSGGTRNVFKNRSSSILLSQTGKAGINYSVVQSGYTTGSPSASLTIEGDYSAFFNLLFQSQYLNQSKVLPSSAYSSVNYNILTDADLTNLAINGTALSPSTITIPDSDNSPPVTTIASALSANTSTSSRTFTLTGTNSYNSGAVSSVSVTKQAGTAQANLLVSISSNETSPRDFYIRHEGNTLSTSMTGTGEGIALWNSTQKVWRIAKLGTTYASGGGVGEYAIRYFGGKYEFIKIESGVIKTQDDYNFLRSTASCSATLMPWKATWSGNIVSMAHSLCDAIEKITELRTNSGLVFPLTGARGSVYKLFSSTDRYENSTNMETYLRDDFKIGQYSKLYFKGADFNAESAVSLKYDYILNKWVIALGQSSVDGDGNSYGDTANYAQRTPSATLTFPEVFDLSTYSQTAGSWTPSSTITISKQTAGALTDRYSLSDITETTTIPVDSAFSSIW
jgi:hypothetical protein